MTQTDQQTGAEVLLRALREQQVDVIFGYPGGAVLPIYDALFQQNSIRHILVLYPFLAIGAAYVTVRAWRSLAALRPRRAATAGTAVVLTLVFWQLSTLWTAYPDYLPYFNEAVPHPERVLVDSDLDWGQDLRRLELRAAQLGIAKLSIAYRGTADLKREPLPAFVVLGSRRPVSGWVAISELARTRNPADYAWLDAYRPLERIGKSIDLYYIP